MCVCVCVCIAIAHIGAGVGILFHISSYFITCVCVCVCPRAAPPLSCRVGVDLSGSAWQNGDGFLLLSFFEVSLEGCQAPSPAEGMGLGGWWGCVVVSGRSEGCSIKRSRNHKENLSGSWQLHNKSSNPTFSGPVSRVSLSLSHVYIVHVCSPHLTPPIALTQTKRVTATPQTTLFFLFSCGSFGSPSPIFQFSATTGKSFHILNLFAGSFSTCLPLPSILSLPLPLPRPRPRPRPHPTLCFAFYSPPRPLFVFFLFQRFTSSLAYLPSSYTENNLQQVDVSNCPSQSIFFFP